MPQTACPFCFRRIDSGALAYQCTGAGARPCTSKEDEARVRLTKNHAESFPTFRPTERSGTPACPECGGPARRRACPECHTALPIDFVDSKSPMIGLVGAKGSGKTVLMTVLVKQLREVVGQRFGAAVMVATDNPDGSAGMGEYKQNRENPLFEGKTLPPGTEQNVAVRRSPVVLRWQQPVRGRLGRESVQSTILSFVDTAGEDLDSMENAFTLNYLSAADSLMVALDPFTLPGARSSLHLPREAIQSSDGSPLEVLNRVTELLKTEHEVKGKKRIKIPMAVVFTKIDAFFDQLEPDSPLRQASSTRAAYDEQAGQEVHEHMRALLARWHASDIDTYLKLNYDNFRYFGVSALGAQPDYASLRLAPGGVQPHRVDEPVLWLMSKAGKVAAA
jgi:GTPase SAR1 family protein